MSFALRALGCRLCWRVTGGVFLSILLVESLILVPSALRFEHEALRRLAFEAEVAVDAMLARGPAPEGAHGLRAALASLVGRGDLQGLAARMADGTQVAAGERLELAFAEPGLRYATDRRHLEVAWRSPAAENVGLFLARLDASGVAQARNAYVLRIAGLVALIVLVVTVGTMLVLHVLVLRPLMRLRESMRLAAAAPERASEYQVRADRRDELGEMIEAHNTMLGRVVDSMRRDRELAEERERILARNDPLTALPNRRAFLEHLSHRRAGDGGAGGITVCLANVVQLRQINAAFGQKAGDALLREIGARLQRAAGRASFVAHLGAGRFALARRAGAASFDAAGFAERLIRDCAGEYPLGEDAASVTLRVGISQAPFDAIAPEELLNQAELALARAAVDDSAGYAFFEGSMAQAAQERQALARALERALARDDELSLVFQAKASLAGAGLALAGCEALVRWRHPSRGPLRPDLFIPIAESTGLVLPLGERVLRLACAQIRAWRERHGRSPRIAVNLSALQFAAPGLLELIERALAESDVPGELLELEITESSAMRDVQHTARTLQALQGLGVRVSIDDFGTGHSSLNYLRRFALDTIKIDKSFVDDIGKDPNADAICAAILGMAHALGRGVVAEGVETEAQLEFLRARGCDEIQGYLFARPEPAEAFAARFLAPCKDFSP